MNSSKLGAIATTPPPSWYEIQTAPSESIPIGFPAPSKDTTYQASTAGHPSTPKRC